VAIGEFYRFGKTSLDRLPPRLFPSTRIWIEYHHPLDALCRDCVLRFNEKGFAMIRTGWLGAALVVLGAPYLAEAQFEDEVSPERRMKMVRRIDALLGDRMADAEVKPAPRSSDAEFLRRATLDLTGVIPRVADVRAFLADESSDKRLKLVERLLASPRHATHLANSWRQFMLPSGLGLQQIQNVAGVQNWLRGQFSQNMRYDRFVSDFLVASGGGDAGPALYYTSLELKPEKLAASTSRIFLGLQIECAQCHPHPFDHWKQEDFWGYAAFFAQLDQSQAMTPGGNVSLNDLGEGEVTLPDTETVIAPKHLDGTAGASRLGGTRRRRLAIWMGSPDNPFLAAAAVNRVWSHMFGRGLVEPVDDLGPHNPPSHPQLMKELASYFVEVGFDLRDLYRTLALTDAYQRTSVQQSEESPPAELFAAMAVKTMTSEQLYDCINQSLMRSPGNGPAFLPAARGLFDPRRLAFAAKMNMQGSNATEFDAGVLQALTMLNGSETAATTSVAQSSLLSSLEAPWFTDEDRVDVLLMATLSRLPTVEERQAFTAHVENDADQEKKRQALSDILWALLNSAEFAMNH
jgi:hypothetical protein